MLLRPLNYLASAIVFALLFAPAMAQNTKRINIIPQPSMVIEKPGEFMLSADTRIISDPMFAEIAELFSSQTFIKQGTAKQKDQPHQIRFNHVGINVIPDSAGYRLLITPERISIFARTKIGALYAMQSLLQVQLSQPNRSAIPCGEISDHPRFGYRGAMIDVSRHFFSASYIKRFIDLMALYKLNTFHWHLVDGPGWRLEIKKYPELTSKGAWRTHKVWKEWWGTERLYSTEKDPNSYGGYYTQEEAIDVVAYAQKRGITVIPEIEMPGHSNEVLGVFPNLTCSGNPYRSGELCLGNDSTFTFLENVLTEVLAIFPSKYIHIGGDEADQTAWKHCEKCQKRIKDEHLKNESELQSYGILRMEKFLMNHKRKLLGWDEILEGGLAPDATVMSWRGEQGGITAAQMGHNVIMSPGSHCYLDNYQADPETQPKAIGGYLTLEKAYSYEPVPAELNQGQAKYILGAQGNIWTEYIGTVEYLEYMTFPRLIALAEVTWSAKKDRNFDDFKNRLQSHYLLMKRLNVNYFRPTYHLNAVTKINNQNKNAVIKFKSEQINPPIFYTLDGQLPTSNSLKYQDSITVNSSSKVTAAILEAGQVKDKPIQIDLDFHLALGKKVTYNLPYSNSYRAQKEESLVNGIRGSLSYGDGQWQGFDTNDFDITIDLEKSIPLTSVAASFLQQVGPGIFIPSHVDLSLSDNGMDFHKVKTIENTVPKTEKVSTKEFSFTLTGEKGRYIRLFAKNGQHGFLFTDEVIVH
jgi:hexosaminidase